MNNPSTINDMQQTAANNGLEQVLCKAQPYEILGAVEPIQIPPATRPTVDLGPILQRLKDCAFGSGVDIATEEPRSRFYPLRQSAIRSGFNLSFRKTDTGFWIIKLPLRRAMSPKFSARDEEIAQRIIAGETFEHVAQHFGISRQRAEQITLKHESFAKLPVPERASALNEFVKPYVDIVKLHPSCIVCGQQCEQKRRGGLCFDCRYIFKIRANIASRIRSYLATNDRRHLRQCVYEIKKFHIRPEDLERA